MLESSIQFTFPFRENTTEQISYPSCALSKVLMHRPLIASHNLIEPSKLPLAYTFAVGAYFKQVTLEVCCCEETALA